jgi:muconolactone delta-isomerase
MARFMVVATFQRDVDWDAVMAVVPQEQARVAALTAAGSIGAVYLATSARRTVFLEVVGADEVDARSIVASLPMAIWWDLDVFELNGQPGVQS